MSGLKRIVKAITKVIVAIIGAVLNKKGFEKKIQKKIPRQKMTPARRKRLESMLANRKPEGIAPKRKRGGQPGNRGGKGAPKGNQYAKGHQNAKGHTHKGAGGRPRKGAEAFTIKLNIAISENQKNKLEMAAQNTGLKYTDFLRNLIDNL